MIDLFKKCFKLFRVRAYGPGIEPRGNVVGTPCNFTVETFSAGKGNVEVMVINSQGQQEPVSSNKNAFRIKFLITIKRFSIINQ